MFSQLSFKPAQATLSAARNHPVASSLFTVGLAGAGAYLLFLHLMQTSAPFAEAVANTISPELANTFACGCPLCSRGCTGPTTTEAFTLDPAKQGLARFSDL